MLQAFLVVPGFIAGYLLSGSRPLGRRLLDTGSLVGAMVARGKGELDYSALGTVLLELAGIQTEDA